MRQLITILIFFFLVKTAHAYNPFWVSIDKRLIKNIVNLDRNNPKAVEQYFRTQKIQKCDTSKDNLGFGWTMWTPGIGGGYIGISATFIYYHDSIVSYSLTPRMPDEKGLINKYKSWYQGGFTFQGDEILPFKYKSGHILLLLKEYNGELTTQTIDHKILEYMTPNSGIMYGYAGGSSGSLLQNRKAFLEIQDSLKTEQIVFLMYSINPASRLTAIEYYLKYKEKFSNTKTIDEWIERNYSEISKVNTLFGCFLETWDTRTLVYMYSKMVDK